MNKYKTIHETPLRAAMDFFTLGSELFKNNDTTDSLVKSMFGKKRHTSTSIAKLTSDMTLVFPVLCSNTLSIDTAMMVSKAIERKAVVMLQLLFSASQIQTDDNIFDIISQYHRNIKLGNANVDDVMNFISDNNLFKLENKNNISEISNARMKALMEDFFQNAFFTYDDSNISDQSILEKYKVNNKRIFKEADEDLDDDKDKKKGKFRDVKDLNDIFSKQLLSSDIKKANELVPTTMIVNFKYRDEKTQKIVDVDNIVLGVKARLIPVSSDDIISHILTKIEDKNFITQLIRATTREISFVKDFLLAIDKAKISALANSRKGSANPMWKVLERRAIESRFRRTIGRPNSANAITTLVVSQEEVEYVKKNYSINLESIKTVNTILDAYKLMGVVVVDETLEITKFHFDSGDDMWETLAFASLEKEDNDKSYKKIVNLMSKVSR